MKKLFYFGLIKKIIILSFLFLSSSNAATHGNVEFTEYEENATLYLVNYYPYQHFRDIYLGSTDSKDIIRKRPFADLYDLEDQVSLNDNQWNYLRQDSHLVEWNKYTDDFGLRLHQTNFLYGLTGVLIGFTFLFMSIFIISTRSF